MKAYILVLKYHGAGFWSIFNKLMNFLQFYTPVYKIVWDVICPHNHYGIGEVMSKMFESFVDDTYKDYELETIDCNMYLNNDLTGQQAMMLYSEETCIKANIPLDWREKLNAMYTKYIQLKPHAQQEMDRQREIIKGYNKKTIITMLIRHPALSREQPNGKLPEFTQYEEVIRSISPTLEDTLIVCLSDHSDAYDYFNSRYDSNTIYFPKVERASTTGDEICCSRERSDEAPLEALRTVYVLSMGDHFIHHTSNMATAAMYINPSMKQYFVIG